MIDFKAICNIKNWERVEILNNKNLILVQLGGKWNKNELKFDKFPDLLSSFCNFDEKRFEVTSKFSNSGMSLVVLASRNSPEKVKVKRIIFL